MCTTLHTLRKQTLSQTNALLDCVLIMCLSYGCVCVCMCACVYVCVSVCVYMCVRAFVQIYLYLSRSLCPYIHITMFLSIYIHVYVYTHNTHEPCAHTSNAYSFKVCCSVLQCVAVCCSVLQCVAVCCSVLYIPPLMRTRLKIACFCKNKVLWRQNPVFSWAFCVQLHISLGVYYAIAMPRQACTKVYVFVTHIRARTHGSVCICTRERMHVLQACTLGVYHVHTEVYVYAHDRECSGAKCIYVHAHVYRYSRTH